MPPCQSGSGSSPTPPPPHYSRSSPAPPPLPPLWVQPCSPPPTTVDWALLHTPCCSKSGPAPPPLLPLQVWPYSLPPTPLLRVQSHSPPLPATVGPTQHPSSPLLSGSDPTPCPTTAPGLAPLHPLSHHCGYSPTPPHHCRLGPALCTPSPPCWVQPCSPPPTTGTGYTPPPSSLMLWVWFPSTLAAPGLGSTSLPAPAALGPALLCPQLPPLWVRPHSRLLHCYSGSSPTLPTPPLLRAWSYSPPPSRCSGSGPAPSLPSTCLPSPLPFCPPLPSSCRLFWGTWGPGSRGGGTLRQGEAPLLRQLGHVLHHHKVPQQWHKLACTIVQKCYG